MAVAAVAAASMRNGLARPASGPLSLANEQRSRPARMSVPEAVLPQAAIAQQAQARPPSPMGQSPASSIANTAMREEESVSQSQAQPTPPKPEPQCTYNAEGVIGNGTFGIVYSAHIVETDETVAIKKVFVDRRYRNRELQIWREMRHPNIVTLKHAFYTSGDSPDELYLNMVMEFVPETVYCTMKRFGKQKLQMPKLLVALYTYQACRALAHLHASSVCHRDIKPQNLLVDAKKGHILKLCDFGSAAQLSANGRSSLVAYICSRYYRAPELIFGATNYTTAVDLWSIGCVMAELLRGRPLFPGENGVDQLVEIVKILGAPNRRNVLAMNPQYFNFSFPNIAPRSFESIFRKGTGKDALSLLSALLQYDPEARLRPLEACAHHYFDDLRDERTRLPDGQPLAQDLFNLTSRELRVCLPSLREKLIPSWYASAALSPGNPQATPQPPKLDTMSNGTQGGDNGR